MKSPQCVATSATQAERFNTADIFAVIAFQQLSCATVTAWTFNTCMTSEFNGSNAA